MKTIRSEIGLAVILISTVVALAVTYYYTAKLRIFTGERAALNAMEMVRRIATDTAEFLERGDIAVDQLVGRLLALPLLQETGPVDPRLGLEALKRERAFMADIKRAMPFIAGIYIIGPGGRRITDDGAVDFDLLYDQTWMNEAKISHPSAFMTIPHRADYARYGRVNEENLFITIGRSVRMGNGPEEPGIVAVDIPYLAFKRVISRPHIEESGILLIQDHKNRLVYPVTIMQDRLALLERTRQNGRVLPTNERDMFIALDREAVYVEYKSDRFGLKFITAMPAVGLAEELESLWINFVLILAAAIAVSAILAFLVSQRIAAPLSRLVAAMDRLGAGEMHLRLPDHPNLDQRRLIQGYNAMADRLQELMERLIQEEKSHSASELRALQAQINPHFLYNTLEVIRGIATANKVPAVADIALSLSKIFRYSILRGEGDPALEEELSYLRDYARIQTYRFGDRFSLDINIMDNCEKCKIPRLTLQPLAENAFKYCVEPTVSGAKIMVSAAKIEGDLYIEVRDNGKGFSPNALAELEISGVRRIEDLSVRYVKGNYKEELTPRSYEFKEYKGQERGTGIGIANVDQRIRLRFGDRYGVFIGNGNGGGGCLIVVLPYGESSL